MTLPFPQPLRHPSDVPRRHSSEINTQPLWYSRRPSILPFPSTRAPRPSVPALRLSTARKKWWHLPLHLRDWDHDEDEQKWWFASTAIPLLAATLGPLANVFSIAALVTSWRMCLVTGISDDESAAQCLWDGTAPLLPHLQGYHFADPRWCLNLNLGSLILGFVGNFFLLCNFTNAVPYIVALPVTIGMWYLATGILVGITAGMHIYVPPTAPQAIYSQGFWYGVIAACIYALLSVGLMINMLGFFLGHYPRYFTLTDSQRTLILQTMLYFLWLAGGAAVFNKIESSHGDPRGPIWSFTNALYWADVTLLTVGFGDIYPTSDLGRGLVIPFSVIGIVSLALMVSSIHRFATELSSENIIKRHAERSRARTMERTMTDAEELARQQQLRRDQMPADTSAEGSENGALPRNKTIQIVENPPVQGTQHHTPVGLIRRVTTMATQPVRRRTGNHKLVLLREEKDRFDKMREIERDTKRFKSWWALTMSILVFGLVWGVGAVVFWQVETETQDLNYFRGLYFAWVSLLTIGYGDLAPQSNAGRPFFVFWSLIAVPTMTILVSDLGATLVATFTTSTSRLADFTVLPKSGAWREFINSHPYLLLKLQNRRDRKAAQRRLEEGFPVGPTPDEIEAPLPTLDELAQDQHLSDAELARKLPVAIKRAAEDMRLEPDKKYSYEEWVYFTQLIRFTARSEQERETDGDEEFVDWDWIGENSPMCHQGSEAEFLLKRLVESMGRYIRGVTKGEKSGEGDGVDEGSRMREGESDEDVGPMGEARAVE